MNYWTKNQAFTGASSGFENGSSLSQHTEICIDFGRFTTQDSL